MYSKGEKCPICVHLFYLYIKPIVLPSYSENYSNCKILH